MQVFEYKLPQNISDKLVCTVLLKFLDQFFSMEF